MPTERMEEVEVARCPDCGGVQGSDVGDGEWACDACGYEGDYVDKQVATTVPGSLTAARLRLADAAVRCHKASIATAVCHTVFGTEEECAAFYARVGYTEANATAVEQECYAAHAEYTAALAAVVAFDEAALRTARGEG